MVDLVHERQSLQLCALHAVNNLLQLSDEPPDLPNGEGTDVWRGYLCDGRVLRRTADQMNTCTKAEIDAIADELTAEENRLLSGGEQHPASYSWPSLYEKLCSNHRTMLFGNYSFEVMEVALRRRGIELSWYRIPDGRDLSKKGVEDGDRRDEHNSVAGPPIDEEGKSPNRKLVIGFIANASGEDNVPWWRIDWYLRYFPLVGRFFRGRHWFSVTRLRTICAGSKEVRETGLERQKESCGWHGWHVIDSDKSETRHLSSEEELLKYLRGLQERGGQVFQAQMAVPSTEEGDGT